MVMQWFLRGSYQSIVVNRPCLFTYVVCFVLQWPIYCWYISHASLCSGFCEAVTSLRAGEYDRLIPLCTQEVEAEAAAHRELALLLRGTMLNLTAQTMEALQDFDTLLALENLDKKVGTRGGRVWSLHDLIIGSVSRLFKDFVFNFKDVFSLVNFTEKGYRLIDYSVG